MAYQESDIVESGPWEGAEVVSVYSRAQALADGTLADVSGLFPDLVREAGFLVPVAATAGVWALVEPTGAEEACGQDVKGRLWDVLWLARLAARGTAGETAAFRVIFQMRGRDGYRNGQRTVTLNLHSGPGDDGEHVLTLLLEGED